MFSIEKYRKISESIGDDVKIVGVSKGKSTEDIMQAVSAGVKIIGESYVQEAERKLPVLGPLFREKNIEFHFIGHFQSNKAKRAVQMFDCIQSIDSERIADLVDKECQKIGKRIRAMIEVNFDEVSKSGVKIEEVAKLVEHIRHKKNIELIGLMCIPPLGKEEVCFSRMKALKEKTSLKELSMGMSNDYLIAVRHGTTMIRIGRAIFGER